MMFVNIYLFCLTTTALVYNVNSLEAESIIGGDKARRGQFKYQVAIVLGKIVVCGGGIIGDYYVITAAHCLLGKQKQFINDRCYVVANTISLNQNRGKSVDVEKIYVKTDYHPVKVFVQPEHDIAVLKLKSALGIDGNHKMNKLLLPSVDETYDGTTAVIAGFGYTRIQTRFDHELKMKVEENGYTDYKLRYAQADVMSNQQCGKYQAEIIHYSYMCARVKQRNKDGEGTCTVDSGSPLVYNNNVVIGILSDSPFGCRETIKAGTGVYTRVSYYRSFIENAMNDHKTADMRVAIVKKKSNYLLWSKTIVEEI